MEKKDMKKNLPPIGTKVYHHIFGEGEIINYKFDNVEVLYLAGEVKFHYNVDVSLCDYVVNGFVSLFDYDKPMVGDWGYFWDNEISFVSYSKVGSLDPLKDVTGVIWCNFSKDIPEHIKKLQNQ